ncbi:MAG: UDP-glucose 4-epimerase GalE [Myxococcota bacterium]
MQRKILVTGGAGFIGSHTVVDLIESGFEPVLIDNFSNSDRSVLAGLEKICGRPVRCHDVDCADEAAVHQIFSDEGEISGVIHFAASKAVGESQENPLLYYRNNLGSLITMLSAMVEFGVQDFVFSSSCTVYGQPDQLPVTEETPIAEPASVYGATKQICEQIVRDTVASGASIRATLLRYFNPIGAHPSAEIGELPLGDPQNLAPIILQSAAGMRGPIQVYGDDWSTPDGSCIRDYIHVLDLAAAHVKSLAWMERQPDAPLVEVLNVGTGRGTTVLEALHAFERATGKKVEWKIGPRREGDIEQIYASVDKAETTLNWRAERSVDDALRDAWRWQERLGERG